VWSDAVNIASRMESTGTPGRIQVTESTYRRLCEKYTFEPRGEIDVKGKGLMKTYFLVGRMGAAGVRHR
jgi:adenylate cyclase